jgi:thiamine biosynthesis lipoprotein
LQIAEKSPRRICLSICNLRSAICNRMRRRDFLHPRHAATAAGHVLGAVSELPSVPLVIPPPSPDEVALLRLGWRAMATHFEIVVPFDTPGAAEAGEEAFALLDALEDQLTVYRDHSEVSRLNRLAPERAVRVEAGLFGLLKVAGEITRECDGAFDVTAGALVKAWGFFKGPRRVPSEPERCEARKRVGMDKVVLDDQRRTVRYLCRGLEINLGSIGKGYALDRLANLLTKKHKLPAVLLHGGHSSVYARGEPKIGTQPGWPVRIRHPWAPERHLATVRLRNQALGTSAATFQFLEHEGRKLGHVLDPRTGWPASGLASASVVAPTGALADALSTAFYVGGREIAERYCRAHPEVGAILLPEGEGATPVVLGLGPDEVSV